MNFGVELNEKSQIRLHTLSFSKEWNDWLVHYLPTCNRQRGQTDEAVEKLSKLLLGSDPVNRKPRSSRSITFASQSVRGRAPMKMNMALAGTRSIFRYQNT